MASFNKLRKLINKYEKEFSMNNYNGDLTKENSYTYINGIIPILISAPHCVNHYRGGNLKKAEILTGSLLKVLHRRTNCHIIYKNKNDGYDFNYDRNGMANEYKEKIIDIIEKERIVFFIDIHGMN